MELWKALILYAVYIRQAKNKEIEWAYKRDPTFQDELASLESDYIVPLLRETKRRSEHMGLNLPHYVQEEAIAKFREVNGDNKNEYDIFLYMVLNGFEHDYIKFANVFYGMNEQMEGNQL